MADSGELFALLKNLVENAVDHSPEGGTVRISLTHGGVRVEDEGQGVAEHQRSQVFERFWRAADNTKPGSGLVNLQVTATYTCTTNIKLCSKPVTVTGFVLTGPDAGNYTLSQPSGLTANITKADLLVTGLTAQDRAYDTGTVAGLVGTPAVQALLTDVVTLQGSAAGAFANKAAGANKAVTVTGLSLASGGDNDNYRLVLPTGEGVPSHQVAGEATLQCLEGRLRVDAEGREQVLEAGQLLYVPGGLPYAITALRPASALLTIALKPSTAKE